MSWSGSLYAKGRNRIVFTTLKIALLAPIPSISAKIATIVNAGLFKRTLTPYLTSCISVSMDYLLMVCGPARSSYNHRIKLTLPGTPEIGNRSPFSASIHSEAPPSGRHLRRGAQEYNKQEETRLKEAPQ